LFYFLVGQWSLAWSEKNNGTQAGQKSSSSLQVSMLENIWFLFISEP